MPLAFSRAGLAHLGAGIAKQMRTVLHLCNTPVALVAALFTKRNAFTHIWHVAAGVRARLAVGGASLAGLDDLIVVVHSYSAMIA